MLNSQVSVSSPILSTNTAMPSSGNAIRRKSANYQPSVWGDYFLHYSCDPEEFNTCTQEVETLKEDVRKILKAAKNQPLEQIKLIDALQRLGVGYHFELEIEEALKELHDQAPPFNNDDDLYATALFFRLLRQQGYNVSCDVFAKFKNDKGEFTSSIVSDVKGMLSLYEAAHFMFQGEDILEDARSYTTTNLTSIITSNTTLSCSPLGRQVQYSLEQPLQRGMPRLEARHYISLYQEDEKWSNLVKKLAILDFKLVQSFHRKELSDLTRWWKDLDFNSKLTFARDRLVECYFWALGAYFEPSYSIARVFLTKVIALTGIIDDTYDVYGTLEELQLFTDAIQRWDATAIDQLPEYMKICYQALLYAYDEMEEKLRKDGTSYQVCYSKEAMKDLVRAYLAEAKWLSRRYVPKLEEYIENAVPSSGYYMLCITCLVGMGATISKEAFEWVKNVPKPVKSSAFIGRLMDDLVSHKFEQEREHVASAVECYMEEYGVTEEEACDALKKMIEEAWKDINEECFTRNNDVAPMPLLMRLMNLTRMLYVVYKYEDTFTHSGRRLMKGRVTLLFVDPLVP